MQCGVDEEECHDDADNQKLLALGFGVFVLVVG